MLRNLLLYIFQGLNKLSFIELSDNNINKISPTTFTKLSQLKILKLKGNHLKMSSISQLKITASLEEIDLSSNDLVGPIDLNFFPRLTNLRELFLSHNSLSSIKKGSFENFRNLTTLYLDHNQIDVLEDHAFRNLTTLTNLDLSNNRIVAISGASLAHLVNLLDLNLKHNYLRALTADLILPLRSIQNLSLDDNEISMVASDALRNSTVLKRLTLTRNPLNCDCSIIEFATWLSRTKLSKGDKETAICTTPPSLENGLLIEIPIDNLLCGEDDDSEALEPKYVNSRINLQKFFYDGSRVDLQWNVEDKVLPYTCDAILIYEEEDSHEVLLETNQIQCNSSKMDNPNVLNITIPNSTGLQPGHSYKYCIVLLESARFSDEVSLVLGCSDVIALIETVKIVTKTDSKYSQVVSIEANLTSFGNLIIDIDLQPSEICEINLTLLEDGVVIGQQKINCSDPKYTFFGLKEGPYRVCASVVGKIPSSEFAQNPKCITVYRNVLKGLSGLDKAFVCIFLLLSLIVIALIFGVRRILLRPKLSGHQLFLPPDIDEQQQHSKYIKLEATTNL